MKNTNISEDSEARKLLFDCLKKGGATDVTEIGEYEICMNINGRELSINSCRGNDGTAELDLFLADDA